MFQFGIKNILGIFKDKKQDISISLFQEEFSFAKELYYQGKKDVFIKFLEGSVQRIENSQVLTGLKEKSLLSLIKQNIEKQNSKKALDNTFDLLNLLRGKSNKSTLMISIFIFVLSLNFFSPLAIYNKLAPDRKLQNFISKNPDHAIKDLYEIKLALEKYRLKLRGYPTSVAYDGILTCYGKSSSDWIKGLAPTFINELPIDRRKSDDCDKQYYYYSDGVDYKIISHMPPDIENIRKELPNLIDPNRKTWAYGFWSEYGAEF